MPPRCDPNLLAICRTYLWFTSCLLSQLPAEAGRGPHQVWGKGFFLVCVCVCVCKNIALHCNPIWNTRWVMVLKSVGATDTEGSIWIWHYNHLWSIKSTIWTAHVPHPYNTSHCHFIWWNLTHQHATPVNLTTLCSTRFEIKKMEALFLYQHSCDNNVTK